MCVRAYGVCPTCVRPPVSLQLVAPGEPLPTEDPVTDERPLAGVPAQVGPQVGRLAVHLPTALHVADVLFLLRGIAAVPVRRRWSGEYALAVSDRPSCGPAELPCRIHGPQRQPWCACTRKSNICSRSMCGSSPVFIPPLSVPAVRTGAGDAAEPFVGRAVLLRGALHGAELLWAHGGA